MDEFTPSDPSQHDLVVSFISLGAGIDRGVHQEFRAYLDSLSDKVSYEAVPQGYEGEGDYRIDFQDIGAEERQAIVGTIRKICAQSSLVTVQTGDGEEEGR